MSRDAIYLRWGPNRNRADDLAPALGAELVALRWQTKDWLRTPVRYVVQFIQTVLLLLWRRPRVVISQHTQPFCSLASLIYAKLTGAVLVTDCHNGPFVDRIWRRWPLGRINQFIYSRARLNLVHNEEIRRFVTEEMALSGEFTVLWDRIPDFSEAAAADFDGRYVLAICSFSGDEPVEAFLQAAARTPDVRYRVTGDVRRLEPSLQAAVGGNVRFAGYLPNEAYDELLCKAAAAVALSKRQHVLMRACHEAIGAGRPLVTSDSPTARAYLTGGTVFVANEAGAIAAGIREALARADELAGQMQLVRARRQKDWWRQLEAVKRRLGLAGPG